MYEEHFIKCNIVIQLSRAFCSWGSFDILIVSKSLSRVNVLVIRSFSLSEFCSGWYYMYIK